MHTTPDNAHMYPRKGKTKRRIVSVNELASYFRVHRNTMRKKVTEFGTIDFHDLFSVFTFVVWLTKKNVYGEGNSSP